MKRALLAVLALAATSLVVLAGPAHADDCDSILDDTTPPVYVSSTISPTSVVIRNRNPPSITMTVHATDNCGVAYIDADLRTPGDDGGVLLLNTFKLISGTATDGVWTRTIQLSPYEWSGTYRPYEIDIDDVGVNTAYKYSGMGGSLQIRHLAGVKLTKPKTVVKKNKKVTIKGKVDLHGLVDETLKIKVQTRTSAKAKWATVKSIKSNYFGDYSTTVKVTKTKYYRVIHVSDAVATAAVSKTYKVKKK